MSTPSQDLNTLSSFLTDTNPQDTLQSLLQQHQHQPQSQYPIKHIIICPSSLLHQPTTLFTFLCNPQNAPLIKNLTLTFSGGIGHSTPYLYTAVSEHPIYAPLAPEIVSKKLSEAEVLNLILEKFFDKRALERAGVRILVEGDSRNCGENAIFSREILQRDAEKGNWPEHEHGTEGGKIGVLLIQDPTMMRRTRASFEKSFGEGFVFYSWSVFVPLVQDNPSGNERQNQTERIAFTDEVLSLSSKVWDINRFIQLVLGEIPRLRDDEFGYGPKGRGFIGHVDIPDEVESAWGRLVDLFDYRQL